MAKHRHSGDEWYCTPGGGIEPGELSEVDRAYLWSAGLLSIPAFAAELDTWAREISYPGKRAGK